MWPVAESRCGARLSLQRNAGGFSDFGEMKIMENQAPAIAVVGGTGAEGSAIALRLAHAGYRVTIGTRDTAKGERVTGELNKLLGSEAIAFLGNAEAAKAADIVILTVPYAAQKPMIQDIAACLDGKILIDATAPLVPPKVSNVQLPSGGSAVAEMQRMLGDKVRVVSAFQNVAAHKLRQLDADVACDVLVCGDDPDARRTACALIGRMGLRALEAGPISNSAAAEALTSLLIFFNRKYKVSGSGIRITGLDEGETAPASAGTVAAH
jgi:8-hydroxy-5-deazaflavin:NADPH oxidoreductase